MEIQHERTDTHRERITVAISAERFDTARKAAAKKLSQRYRIPGFRKGKVPYNILARHIGENTIVEAATESLMQQVYEEVIQTLDLTPHAPGELVEVVEELPPTFIYEVPLAPEVDLGDYRSLRLPFEPPEVSDENVDKVLQQLRVQNALVEESHRPVALGNRVTVQIQAIFQDDPHAHDDDADHNDDTTEDEHDHEHEHHDHAHAGDYFIQPQEATLDLIAGEVTLLEGFAEALIGANKGDDVVFTLTVPENPHNEDFSEIVGRELEFNVTINKIEALTLPALNDDFAARIGRQLQPTPAQGEADRPARQRMSLLELRMKVRESLQSQLTQEYESDYANRMVALLTQTASIAYPQEMVEEAIDDILREEDTHMRQEHNISLADQLKISGMTPDDLRPRLEPQARQRVQRNLVLSQLIALEDVRVPRELVEYQVEVTLAQFGDKAESVRSLFDNADYRHNIASNLMIGQAMRQLVSIGRGEAEAQAKANEGAGDAETATENTPQVRDDATATAAPAIDQTEADAADTTSNEPSASAATSESQENQPDATTADEIASEPKASEEQS